MGETRRRSLSHAGDGTEAPRERGTDLAEYEEAACRVVDGCLVCGDVAVPVTVVRTDDDADPLCRDLQGNEGRVAADLVGRVDVGDRLLVHAGVAIERLAPGRGPTREGA